MSFLADESEAPGAVPGVLLSHERRLVPWTDAERAAWLERRLQGVGASDSPCVMGLSEYTQPLKLWLTKTRRLKPEPMSEAQFMGLVQEPLVAALYERHTGRSVAVPVEFITHPDLPFLFANLDRVADDRIVECKNYSSESGWGKPGTDQVPDHILVQAQHQMLVSGVRLTDVAVLFAGSRFRVYTVPFDRGLADHIVEADAAFWDLVRRGVPPAPDFRAEDTASLLCELHRDTGEWGTVLPSDHPIVAEGLADRHRLMKLAHEDTEARLLELKNRIVAAMGAAGSVVLPDGTRIQRVAKTGKPLFKVTPPHGDETHGE